MAASRLTPERGFLANRVPYLAWRAAGGGKRPAVLFLHGARGSKDDVPGCVADRLNHAGVALIAIDAPGHGDRASRGVGAERAEYNRLARWNHYRQAGEELFAVFEALQADPGINAERIGLAGNSMGATTALVAVGMGLSARAVLSIAGWAGFARWVPDDPDSTALGEAIDPIVHAAAFPPRPVLLVHGTADDIVPIAGHRALYEVLLPHYSEHPQDLLFVEHAGDHGTPSSVVRMGCDWLVLRLQE